MTDNRASHPHPQVYCAMCPWHGDAALIGAHILGVHGIDTQIETELIAASHSEDEIRDFVGADSLGYLSIQGVLAALDLPYERFCFACFDGHYPEPVPYDVSRRKFILEDEGAIAGRA